MTCQSILTQPPATLSKGTTVAEAMAQLAATRAATLPVVDAKGHFAGVFGVREAIGLVLPRAARAQEIQDLSFVGDSLDDLKVRLGAAARDPVSRHMAPHRTVRPETSLVEALLLLYRGDAFLPVCDDAGHLVGIATAADCLTRLSEKP
ncbi:MAG: HPP family protein [Actinomycetota bacterium]